MSGEHRSRTIYFMKLRAREVKAWASKGTRFPHLEDSKGHIHIRKTGWYFRPLAEEITTWYGPYESRKEMTKAVNKHKIA